MAPPRPDLYSQRTTPNGAAQPGVRNVGFGSGIGRSLAQAGQALGDVAQSKVNMQEAELRVEDIQRQREEEDGRAYAAKAIAEYRATANAERRRIFEEAPDGWRGATENTAIRLGELREEVAGRAPTPTARRFVEESIDAYNPLYLDGVAEDEQRQRERYHVDTISASITTEGSNLTVNPQEHDVTLARTVELVNGIQGIGADARRSLIESAREQYANAAITAMIERDPRGTLRLLNSDEPPPVIAGLTASQRTQYKDRTENEIERRNAKWKASIQERLSAAQDLWELGLDAPNAPTEAEVRSAFGADRAMAYQARRAMAAQIGGMSARSSNELAQTANNAALPKPQRDAAESILKQRAEDSARFAIRNGMMEDGGLLAALQGGDWDAFDTALRQRGAAATQNSASWGTTPNPLTAFETNAVNALLSRATAQDKTAFFQRAARALGQGSSAYMALLDQVAGGNPITAYAGYASAQAGAGAAVGSRDRMAGSRAARLVLRGQEVLAGGAPPSGEGGRRTPSVSTVNVVSDDLLRRRWLTETAGAYPTAESNERAFQAFRSAYAALQEESGDVRGITVTDALAKQALAAATGGIATINGRRTPLPFMSQQEFLQRARNQLDSRFDGGYTFDDLEFQPTEGVNRYAVLVGGRPVLQNNRPLTVTIRR